MKHIVILTDFSEASFNAIKYTLKLYISEEVKFHLLHVVDNNSITVNLINGALIEDVYSGIIRVAKDNMYEFKERVNSISINRVHKFSFKVIFGDFIEVVNDYCVNQNIYMLIMGTTGTTRLKDVFLGSTATKIIHNVDIPILAIPKKVEYHSLDKIIFPVDYLVNYKSSYINPILNILEQKGAELNLLYVNENKEIFTQSQELNKIKLEEVLKSYKIKSYLVNGTNLYGTLSYLSEDIKADMIVMIKKDEKRIRLFNVSKIKKVSYYIRKPLLILPELNESISLKKVV